MLPTTSGECRKLLREVPVLVKYFQNSFLDGRLVIRESLLPDVDESDVVDLWQFVASCAVGQGDEGQPGRSACVGRGNKSFKLSIFVFHRNHLGFLRTSLSPSGAAIKGALCTVPHPLLLRPNQSNAKLPAQHLGASQSDKTLNGRRHSLTLSYLIYFLSTAYCAVQQIWTHEHTVFASPPPDAAPSVQPRRSITAKATHRYTG